MNLNQLIYYNNSTSNSVIQAGSPYALPNISYCDNKYYLQSNPSNFITISSLSPYLLISNLNTKN